MGEKDAIRAEQTPRKKGEVELYTRTEMQQTLTGKNKRFLLII
jgi:nitrogen-specific signal transduction histidine kinase